MNTKKKTIKTILGCTVACSTLALCGAGLSSIEKFNKDVRAIHADQITVSDLKNPNFNGNTSSTYPFSPNSYAKYNGDLAVSSSSNDEHNVTAGVINLSDEKYETKFINAKRSSLDNYVLMIDSTDKDDETKKHSVNYGYRTTSTIKLDANSKYEFTVDVFNATDANISSLYLYDLTNKDENDKPKVLSSIRNINSYNGWSTYSFFVSTNNMDSIEISLGMYLEGAGTVLFDNLSAFKVSDSDYAGSIKHADAGSYRVVNLSEDLANIVETFTFNDNDYLTNGSDSTSLKCVSYENGKNDVRYVEDSDGQNKNAILIKNTEKSFTQYETEDILTFKQNKHYMVSVNVKTKDLSGTATLELIRTDDKDDTKHNQTIKITSNSYSPTVESVTNDYTTYNFLINSSNSSDATYKLKFGLGSESDLTSGEMYLSEIEVSLVDYEVFNAGSNKIDFVEAYKDSKIILDNGDFNAFKIEDLTSPSPATPISWTETTGDNQQVYGVVNTKTLESDLAKLNLSNLSNPASEDNNNILMMHNATADTLSYKSTEKKLDANSYHRFEVNVQTQNAPLKISLVTTKDNEEITLLSTTVNTNYTWQLVSLHIYTGFQDVNVSLKLTLETESYGYAYIDNAYFDNSANKYPLTQEQLKTEFNTIDQNSINAVKTDLSKILSSASTEKFAKPDFFTFPKNSGVETGTVTLKKNYLEDVIYDSDLYLEEFNSKAVASEETKAIAIWTTDYVDYSLTSNTGFTLKSGSYYKITVDMFTQKLTTQNTEGEAGAGISLVGFDNAFTKISSNNVWTTYTFYIKPETTTTTYIKLSLGDSENKTQGCAFFTNIKLDSSITEDDYNSAVNSDIVKIVTPVKSADDDNKTDSTPTENKSQKSDINWFILIPSLLTVVSILIAIIGFIVRKIKWKNPFKKKTKTTYDRNKTVSVQYYTRKATTIREEKVRELTQDLEKINAERKKYEDQYKQDLSKLREMKIKRANAQEITKLEKEMKKNQKMSSSLGLTANKIVNDLAYTKSDSYLNSLIKKLSKESANVEESNEENNK